MMLRLLTALIATWAALGCGAAAVRKPTAPPPPLPGVITDATYDEVLRAYLHLSVGDPNRTALRKRLSAYLLNQRGEAAGEDDFEVAVDLIGSITGLYSPRELAEEELPAGLGTLARVLVDKGSPRGDEARVLSGLFLLSRLEPDRGEHAQLYRRIKRWGFDARSAQSAPLDRFEGLVEAWEEHARLTPTPGVLDTLARLHVDRRDALFQVFRSPEQRRVPPSAAVFHGLQQTAMNVAAIYLRHGDVASAAARVEAMGSAGGSEERLLEYLQMARDDGPEGTAVLIELAAAFRDGGRPDVARGLCIYGLRRQRGDARFSQCLARVAASEHEAGDALAWYAEAIRLVPDDRVLYDEVLEVLSRMIEQDVFGSDSEQTQLLAARASELLAERMERWPDDAPPVKPEELYLAIGMAEMNVGNAEQAEGRLRASLKARETVGALMELGMLLERLGRHDDAAAAYKRALGLSTEGKRDEGEGRGARRAEIHERLAGSLRAGGDAAGARKHYQKALALWDGRIQNLSDRRLGLAHLRRGVLLGRLGRERDAIVAFEKAMTLVPQVRDTYATILAYLVVTEPNSEFAHRVFRHALNQLSLEPEWKVYFALWLRTIAGRKGQATESDVDHVFEDLADGDDWPAMLAQFASGRASYESLLKAAETVGERTEAHFYEGARRLGKGDLGGARTMFQRVLDTHMVNFYEFAMAQELIDTMQAGASGAPPAPRALHP
ncbi:MAG: tetratricopeptide repeat protein [Myxococcales bacterium]|nr:tetratricopeptide repeat protein [Myxococcales bacterium]